MSLFPPRRALLGPGPSDVHPRVLEALSRPLLGHLDPQFLHIMNDCQALMRDVFRTKNFLTFPVSGTGSAGMETCVVNLIEPGDSMLVAVNGVFGTRMVDVAERTGAKVTRIDRKWGEAFSFEEVEKALRREKPKVFGIVHAETSTGVWQKLDGIGKVCKETGTLLLVDTVTSLGGVPVEIDQWGIDASYSGTQKCLSCPPGLSPVTFSDRAVEVIEKRKTKVQSWYLDMSMVKRYWGEERIYHHTAPISMIYALHEALKVVVEEGLEARFTRHMLNHRALAAGLAELGLDFVPKEGERLPMLNEVHVPQGVEDLKARRFLLDAYGIEIGGGLGDFKGKAWRIGLMGYGSRADNVLVVLAALEQALRNQDVKVSRGAATAAASEVLANAR